MGGVGEGGGGGAIDDHSTAPRGRRDVIIEKHYRGVTSRASVEVFWEEVNKRTKRDVSGARCACSWGSCCDARVRGMVHRMCVAYRRTCPPSW
jgi:hypothetical protein